MRILVCALLLTGALAGCLSGNTADDCPDAAENQSTSFAISSTISSCNDTDDTDASPVVDPEPISASDSFMAGGDPFNLNGGVPCSQDQSTCFYVPFEIPSGAKYAVDALLSWGLPANDLDLYLYSGSTELGNNGINQIDDAESHTESSQRFIYPDSALDQPYLTAGSYEFVVVVWAGAADSWDLTADFTRV